MSPTMTTSPATDLLPFSQGDATHRIRQAAGVFDALERMPSVKTHPLTLEALVNQVCHDQQLSYSPDQVAQALHRVRQLAAGEKAAMAPKEAPAAPATRLMASACGLGLIIQALGGPFYLSLAVAMAGAVIGLLGMRYLAYLSRAARQVARVTPTSPTKTPAPIQTGWSLAGMAEDLPEAELDIKNARAAGRPEMVAFNSKRHYSYRAICKRQKALADEQRAKRLALFHANVDAFEIRWSMGKYSDVAR